MGALLFWNQAIFLCSALVTFKKDGMLVNVGDTVKQGQHIGYGGNIDYTAFPHLHFQVQDKNGNNIATRFNTKKGIIYLRPRKWYKAVK